MRYPKFLFVLGLICSISWSSVYAQEEDPNVQEPVSEEQEMSASEMIDAAFEPIVNFLDATLFWDPFTAMGIYDPVVYGPDGQPVINDLGEPMVKSIPIVVIWLVLGALFFTIRMGFVNVYGLRHALELVRGKYDNPDDDGEVTHFQALATALSGTVGLGNIAGVAVAVALGGPGATFWMILGGFLGMSSKFVECTLGVKYRDIDENGKVSGGPMHYLNKAMAKKGYATFGKILAGLFAVLCIGASFGGGNMFQANQALEQVTTKFPSVLEMSFLGIDGPVWFGIIMALLVGLVIIGGIKSIAKVTDKIVPLMVGTYVLFALIIIGLHIENIGGAFGEIFYGAFDADALKGGFVGVLITGFQRAAFSNEAGVGSASIAHSASKTSRPISEGLVALMEPFIDTVVVCTMTALVLIFTGYADDTSGLQGAALTSAAFSDIFSWFDWVLLVAILLFAFSTMISWSYYGIKSWTYVFGESKATITIYKVIFLFVIVIGSASSLGNVMAFSDMMILGMAFPNIMGLYFLSGEVRKDLTRYFEELRNGDIKAYK